MTAVLGVDGGGTKTHVVVADETGQVLGVAIRGPSNWEEVGLPRAADALDRAVTMALAEAFVQPQDLAASVFGLAGVDWESDQLRIGTILRPLQLGGQVDIMNDAYVALRTGTSRSFGVAVIAGTGSVVAGRNPDGETFRTLGLGAYFGDYGGGSDISESALTAVCEAYLGKGPQTALSDVMCAHEHVRSVPELLELVSREQDDLPYVASEVMEVAESGDEVAREIVERSGRELGRNAALVATQLGMQDTEFELVLAGGLFQTKTRLLVDPLFAAAREGAHRARVVRVSMPPVVGAVAMARERAGLEVDESVMGRIAAGMNEPLRAAPMERI
ncbi:MAG: ATPase [Actinomycetota bacterium]|nr:ATPase [Actinomycetota bacterium]